MDEEKDKQIKISAERHQKLKMLSAQTGREMRDIIGEAFDEYIKKNEK